MPAPQMEVNQNPCTKCVVTLLIELWAGTSSASKTRPALACATAGGPNQHRGRHTNACMRDGRRPVGVARNNQTSARTCRFDISLERSVMRDRRPLTQTGTLNVDSDFHQPKHSVIPPRFVSGCIPLATCALPTCVFSTFLLYPVIRSFFLDT